MSEPTATSRSSESAVAPALASTGDVVADGMQTTHKRRRLTDSARMPALRLNRPVQRAQTERRPAVVYDNAAPGHLRFTRLLVGLALLAAAWACILLVVAMVVTLSAGLPHQHLSLSVNILLWALGAFGMVWLAVMAIALILVGAFSFALALTRRKW